MGLGDKAMRFSSGLMMRAMSMIAGLARIIRLELADVA
jgi:hypothetical protein